MITIDVPLAERGYQVHIRSGLLRMAGDLIAPLVLGRRAIIVADQNVRAHLDTLRASLAAAGLDTASIVLPAGERTKSWRQLEGLCDRLLDLGVERGDRIIALGGGVIGDLAGFACAIVKRGCGVVQIPTTLLAQVDSSVGGKTGINTRAGKNLIGAFHQPEMVLIDPDVLDTLPARDVRAGYAEVVKYALIDDAAFFDWCEANGEALVAGDRDALEYAIARSVASKARIVASDPYETAGRRALLNLGHTFGHALEAESGFSGGLVHGEAVAAGCALAFAYSARLGLCDDADSARVSAHWRAVGLPDRLGATGIDTSGARLIERMRHDKKMSGGTLPFVLVRGIGAAFLDRSVDPADVEAFLDEHPR